MQWPYLVMPVVYFLQNDEHSVHSAHSLRNKKKRIRAALVLI
jgi:hypothetical protein